jgi:hypothetical protein
MERLGTKQEMIIMFTQMKPATELADLVVAEARRTGKCSNLTGGTVRANGHPGDWKFSSAWTGSGVSDDCRNELTAIETRLKQRGFGLKG